jgi:hypothetical protein
LKPTKGGLLPLLDLLLGMVTVLENATVIIEAIVRDGSIEFVNSLLIVLGFNLELVVTANSECVVLHNETHYAQGLKKVKRGG